jgi:hypothetical protein
MALQPDFREQKSMLEEAINQRGHIALFLPKFHPEFNWIEPCWAREKDFTNCKVGGTPHSDKDALRRKC